MKTHEATLKSGETAYYGKTRDGEPNFTKIENPIILRQREFMILVGILIFIALTVILLSAWSLTYTRYVAVEILEKLDSMLPRMI